MPQGMGFSVKISTTANLQIQPQILFVILKEQNMKFAKIFAAAVLTVSAAAAVAGPISANRVAKSGAVNYSCQQGERVTVRYTFNAAGVPVTATARLNGANRVMRYDLDRSDNVDTFFKDARGYNLSTDAMDSRNFRRNAINISAPDSSFLFKDCSPR